MIAVERNALIALIKWAQAMPVGVGPEHETLSDAYDALEHCIIFDVGPVDPEVRAAYFAPHPEPALTDQPSPITAPIRTCPRCGSPRWVAVSLDQGYTRRRQCVPCGAIWPGVIQDESNTSSNAPGGPS